MTKLTKVSINHQNSQELIRTIDLTKWEDQEFNWTGYLPVSYFSRLTALALDKPHDQLQVECQLNKVRDVLWLSFVVKGSLWLECQRCLQPVAVELNKSHQLALLRSESQVSGLEEEQDYLMLDELVDVAARQQLLQLAELIEDEVILDLPLAAKHSDCEMVVEQVGEIEEEEPENPFAALAGLKGQLS